MSTGKIPPTQEKAQECATREQLIEALKIALNVAEDWLYSELGGTSLLEAEQAKLAPCYAVLERAEHG